MAQSAAVRAARCGAPPTTFGLSGAATNSAAVIVTEHASITPIQLATLVSSASTSEAGTREKN